MAKPDLHRAINDLVAKRLKKALQSGEMINLPDWISEIAESLADMIVQGAPDEEQERMIRHALKRLKFFVREKQRIEIEEKHKR